MKKSTINTIIGIVIIFGIIVGYTLLTRPSKEELAKKRKEDSTKLVAKYKEDSTIKAKKITDSLRKVQIIADTLKAREQRANDSLSNLGKPVKKKKTKKAETISVNDITAKSDSVRKAEQQLKSGSFSLSTTGSKKPFILENELLKLRISRKSGFISSVQLKKYVTYEKSPLILYNCDTTFKVNFYGVNNVLYKTSDFYFEPYCTDNRFTGKDSMSVKGNDSLVFSMRLYPDGADSVRAKDKYIEFRYVLRGNNYMIGFQIRLEKMQDILGTNSNYLFFEWMENLRQQEKSLKPEHNATTVYYKPAEDDVDYLSETKDDEKQFKVPVKWVSFKQQFFSSTLIAKESFKEATLKVQTLNDTLSPRYLKTTYALLTVPYTPSATQTYDMSLYYGPNQYKILTKYNLSLERQIPLGWGFFLLQWINRFAVIPIFNWLENYGINYGIIILILTILLKIVLFPIAYKTYKSSAKMRILKPEIEEIGKKFPKKEDAMKKQQATMALYKKAGVNPMAGCIPLLLQMPILIAMYRFFPASIELRQQPFLWAYDLSTYDSIANLGFSIPFYGDHISLFTLLMTISTVIYTWLNNQLMGQTNQMPAMKWMMYLMPIMFLGFFNNFAAGLSYYYLLANLITFLQMYLFRKFTNEEKIHAKIQENKKKPVKKSGFQARLEEMARKRGYNPPKK